MSGADDKSEIKEPKNEDDSKIIDGYTVDDKQIIGVIIKKNGADVATISRYAWNIVVRHNKDKIITRKKAAVGVGAAHPDICDDASIYAKECLYDTICLSLPDAERGSMKYELLIEDIIRDIGCVIEMEDSEVKIKYDDKIIIKISSHIWKIVVKGDTLHMRDIETIKNTGDIKNFKDEKLITIITNKIYTMLITGNPKIGYKLHHTIHNLQNQYDGCKQNMKHYQETVNMQAENIKKLESDKKELQTQITKLETFLKNVLVRYSSFMENNNRIMYNSLTTIKNMSEGKFYEMLGLVMIGDTYCRSVNDTLINIISATELANLGNNIYTPVNKDEIKDFDEYVKTLDINEPRVRDFVKTFLRQKIFISYIGNAKKLQEEIYIRNSLLSNVARELETTVNYWKSFPNGDSYKYKYLKYKMKYLKLKHFV